MTMRLAGKDDLDFCHDAWVRSLSDAPDMRWLPMPLYRRLMNPRVERWLSRYASSTWVAVAEGEPTLVLGFVCACGPDAIMYAYVKHSLRRLGVGYAMLSHAFPAAMAAGQPIKTAFCGPSCPSIIASRPASLIYQPTLQDDPRRRQQNKAQTRTQVFRSPGSSFVAESV